MAVIPKLPLPLYRSGMIREEAVDQMLVPETSLEFAMNLDFDSLGAVKLRKGLTILGSQIGSSTPVLGIGNYRNNAGTTFSALANVLNDVYHYQGSSWVSVRSGLTSGGKADFANFIDLTYMVNGNGNQACQTYNGTTFGTTGVGSLPAGDFVEQYRSRIWVADNATDKVFYSNVVSTTNTLDGGASFLQISPQDGEKITGLKRHPRALLVFKNNHIYRIFSINSTDPDPSIMRGTYSKESIIEAKNGIYYHHPTGFYKFVFDGEQTEISRPIIDIVKAIPRSYYENVSGWDDEDHCYWSIGDITLGGVSFTNIVVRYTISTQVWTVRSYSSEIRSSGLYDDGSANLVQLVGDDDGNVLQFDTGTTDNGSPIFFDLITHWETFTNVKSTIKSLSKIAELHENAEGGSLSYQVDNDRPNAWRPIKDLRQELYEVMTIDAKNFMRIRFRLAGSSSGSPFIFRGLEMLGLITEGTIKKYQ